MGKYISTAMISSGGRGSSPVTAYRNALRNVRCYCFSTEMHPYMYAKVRLSTLLVSSQVPKPRRKSSDTRQTLRSWAEGPGYIYNTTITRCCERGRLVTIASRHGASDTADKTLQRAIWFMLERWRCVIADRTIRDSEA